MYVIYEYILCRAMHSPSLVPSSSIPIDGACISHNQCVRQWHTMTKRYHFKSMSHLLQHVRSFLCDPFGRSRLEVSGVLVCSCCACVCLYAVYMRAWHACAGRTLLGFGSLQWCVFNNNNKITHWFWSLKMLRTQKLYITNQRACRTSSTAFEPVHVALSVLCVVFICPKM